jgi:S-disulfanyl-L-cysteine oxidoreductase SoxD
MALAAFLGACATPSAAPGPGLAAPALPEQLAAWDTSIPPNGVGLPAGAGTAREGARVYARSCVACHGANGSGKPADPLVGGIGSLASRQPLRTVGSYWPYAATLFDYVRRAMPLNAPLSLTNDEVYAVSAYVLYLNGIIAQDDPVNAHTLPLVKMPNRDGFINAWEEKR